MVKWANIIKIVSVTDTLKSLPLGELQKIKYNDAKETVIRSVANRLKKDGYSFKVKGTCDGTEVMRIK